MSKHDDEMGRMGYFLPEDSEFRLRKLRDHMEFLSRLAQPRSAEEEDDGGTEIQSAELEVCLELLAEQVQLVLDEVSWPAERVKKKARSKAAKATEAEPAEVAPGAADDEEATAPDEPDAAAEPYAFGITGDQFDTLDRLVQTISAHGDMVANGDAAALASDTVPLVGQAIFDGMEAVRAILDEVEAQQLRQPGVRTGVGEERAIYGARVAGGMRLRLPPPAEQAGLRALH